MPPKRNKNKPNGFSYFMNEMKQKSAAYRNVPMNELAVMLDSQWKSLSQQEKQRYNALAKNVNSLRDVVKFTSEGISVDHIQHEMEEEQRKIKQMHENTNRFLTMANLRKELGIETFVIMHVNHLVRCETDKRYYICEIALAAFTLEGGVDSSKVFHRIILPGQLPLGYKGTAKLHSEQTHQLLDFVTETEEDNTGQVIDDMLRFLRPYAKNRELPYIFVQDNILEMVQKTIQELLVDHRRFEVLNIYELQYMFYALRNQVNPGVWPTTTPSHSILERDPYVYTPKIACDYHEMCDNLVYCSRSIVIRLAYTICDNCCTDLGITMVPGFHVPRAALLPNSAPAAAADLDDFVVPKRTFRDRKSEKNKVNEAAATAPSRITKPDVDSFGYDNFEPSNADYKFEEDNESLASTTSSSTVVGGYDDSFPALGARGSRPPPQSLPRSYAGAANAGATNAGAPNAGAANAGAANAGAANSSQGSSTSGSSSLTQPLSKLSLDDFVNPKKGPVRGGRRQ